MLPLVAPRHRGQGTQKNEIMISWMIEYVADSVGGFACLMRYVQNLMPSGKLCFLMIPCPYDLVY